MIKDIKIYGERNSGTNFIEKLCEINFKNCTILSGIYNKGSGWKHGYPRLKLFKNVNETLFICVIRNLSDWLNSMYNRPYHLIKRKTFTTFITKTALPNDRRKYHDVNRFRWEKNKNLFQLRYHKYNKYKSLLNKVPHAILVNLDYVQKNKGNDFINIISKKFNLLRTEKFQPILKHTKTYEKEQNAKYKKYKIVKKAQKYINNKIESEIKELNFCTSKKLY